MPIVGPESAVAATPTAETDRLITGRTLKRAFHAVAAGLVLGLLLPASHAGRPAALAQDTLRAVAVVNDEVISMLDLFMRTRLVALSSGIQVTPESQSRLQQQVAAGTSTPH
jgi:peptidyl-prolyl cis-trans isomerase SurA